MSEHVRINTYTNVTDPAEFARGPFTLVIYQHASKPIVYEVREYHDVHECKAYISPEGRTAYAENLATVTAVEHANFDIRAELLRTVTERLERFLTTEGLKGSTDAT